MRIPLKYIKSLELLSFSKGVEKEQLYKAIEQLGYKWNSDKNEWDFFHPVIYPEISVITMTFTNPDSGFSEFFKNLILKWCSFMHIDCVEIGEKNGSFSVLIVTTEPVVRDELSIDSDSLN